MICRRRIVYHSKSDEENELPSTPVNRPNKTTDHGKPRRLPLHPCGNSTAVPPRHLQSEVQLLPPQTPLHQQRVMPIPLPPCQLQSEVQLPPLPTPQTTLLPQPTGQLQSTPQILPSPPLPHSTHVQPNCITRSRDFDFSYKYVTV